MASPAARKPRTLVLCFDGTADEYGAQNTNVVKLYSLLAKDHVEDQLCYYQAGIGTYFQPGVVKPVFRFAARVLDEAFAWYLPEHVINGYTFLMQNYNEGDRVCLFGFSRGAYTARALAGMLHKVGLLSKDNHEQVSFAYRMYKSEHALSEGFKRTFARSVPIEFLGVWDTVASVGLIKSRSLPFVEQNRTIKTFRHALALDEHRAAFRPSLYHHPPRARVQTLKRAKTILKARFSDLKEKVFHKAAQNASPSADEDDEDDARSDISKQFETDVKEVWFAGCHCDVGGGSVPDTAPHALANIPLRWMVQEIVRARCGIVLDEAALARMNCVPLPDPPVSDKEKQKARETTAEETVAELDELDALQPINDQLRQRPMWWLMELIPTVERYRDCANGDKWVKRWSFHFGRGRNLPSDPAFHESVRMREENEAQIAGYNPRARFMKGSETYVS